MRLSPKKINRNMKKTLRLIQQELPLKTIKKMPTLPAPVERPKQARLSTSAKKTVLKSLSKQISRKKARMKSSHSKRTSPGDLLTRDAAPAYPHKEGQRWIKNTQSQTNTGRVISTRHASKKSSKMDRHARYTGKR